MGLERSSLRRTLYLFRTKIDPKGQDNTMKEKKEFVGYTYYHSNNYRDPTIPVKTYVARSLYFWWKIFDERGYRAYFFTSKHDAIEYARLRIKASFLGALHKRRSIQWN